MSLLGGARPSSQSSGAGRPPRRQASHQFSELARAAIMSSAQSSPASEHHVSHPSVSDPHTEHHSTLMPPSTTPFGKAITPNGASKPLPQRALSHYALGAALTDTPMPSQPSSPQMWVINHLQTFFHHTDNHTERLVAASPALRLPRSEQPPLISLA